MSSVEIFCPGCGKEFHKDFCDNPPKQDEIITFECSACSVELEAQASWELNLYGIELKESQ